MARPHGLRKWMTYLRSSLPIPSWTSTFSQSIRPKLQDSVWKMGPARSNDDNGTVIGMSFRTLGTLPFWEALKLQDRLFHPFKSIAPKVEDTTEALVQGIVDSESPLSGIGLDETWIETAIDQAKLLYPDRLMRTLPGWSKVRMIIQLIEDERGLGPKVIDIVDSKIYIVKCIQEIIEQTNSSYMATQDKAAINAHRAAYFIEFLYQDATWPDITMTLDKDDHQILRSKVETSHFLFKHAWDLEKAVGKAWTPTLMSLVVRRAYKQIYAPSPSNPPVPPCPIIFFGNPTLYRLAYIENTRLYFSAWRSVDPLQAHRILQSLHPWARFPPITQGHLLLEYFAISLLARAAPESLAGFLRTRRNHPDRQEPTIMNASVLMARLMDAHARLWNVAKSVALHGRLPSTITLGRTRVIGILSTEDEALKACLREGKPWVHCLKRGLVWADEERQWVVKAVFKSASNELKAMRAVTEPECEEAGVVGLAGSMEVTVGEYRGMVLIFTRYCGVSLNHIEFDYHYRLESDV
ncbi:hypothetical protein D9615_003299 [Tricholomella constricta]|uniref:Uncharacterized protein n=1 Tax=Tricholomella constricta TaxID=117010 RepID=A0A8H5HJR6_9AGAR|nr:hypothetical protein D9615_003299 [Tricholomella constricta]